jgi:isoamylase
VEQTHVDGFRFDLAIILAREPSSFDNQSGFLKACVQDQVLRRAKLIAEPWDCGPGGYQVGEFPPGLVEWNGKFRDIVRRFWKNDAPASDLASSLSGSGNIFNRNGRWPSASVNFITAHDGFIPCAAQKLHKHGNHALALSPDVTQRVKTLFAVG